VIFNGDATIEGTATESVVVFNGDVEISGTVGDDVVAFNGSVDRPFGRGGRTATSPADSPPRSRTGATVAAR
jgi:hypothetical protein